MSFIFNFVITSFPASTKRNETKELMDHEQIIFEVIFPFPLYPFEELCMYTRGNLRLGLSEEVCGHL